MQKKDNKTNSYHGIVKLPKFHDTFSANGLPNIKGLFQFLAKNDERYKIKSEINFDAEFM